MGEPGGGQCWWLPLPWWVPPGVDVRLQLHVAPSHMLMGQSAMWGGHLLRRWVETCHWRDFPSKNIFENLGDGKEVKKPKLPVGWGHLDVFIPQSYLLFFSKKNSHFLVLQNMSLPYFSVSFLNMMQLAEHTLPIMNRSYFPEAPWSTSWPLSRILALLEGFHSHYCLSNEHLFREMTLTFSRCSNIDVLLSSNKGVLCPQSSLWHCNCLDANFLWKASSMS